MYTIGLVGRKNDPHIKMLSAEVTGNGDVPVIIDMYNYPEFNLLTSGDTVLYDDINVLEDVLIDSVDILCVRDYGLHPVGYSAEPALQGRMFADARCVHAAIFSLVKTLERRIPVVNPKAASQFHMLKGWQYARLGAAGVTVPETFITSDPCRARKFTDSFTQGVIAKPNASGAEVVAADESFFELFASGVPRPFIFQQFVSGRSMRIYVIGGRCVSGGIIHFDRSFIDWRERTDRVELFTPDETILRETEMAVRILNLPFCAIDLEYDNVTGKTYFLDFNPSALFNGWQYLTGVNIAAYLARYLHNVVSRNGKLWEPQSSEINKGDPTWHTTPMAT